MAFLNLVKVNTATAGTGTVTLGTAVAGFLTPAQAGAVDGSTYSYGIVDGTNTETGTGTYTAAGTTLTRSVINSTNSNALLTLSGTAIVFLTPNTADLNALAPKASPTFTGTVTIPTPTADTSSTAAASTAFAQNLVGSVSISTTGGATTITSAQAGSEIITVTGTLASAATISFGSGSASFFNRAYTIVNNTTGAFTLTIQACVTTPGTVISVMQGRASRLLVNGTNVTPANNDIASLTVGGASLGTYDSVAVSGGMNLLLGATGNPNFKLWGGATNTESIQLSRAGSNTWNLVTNNASSILNMANMAVNISSGLYVGNTNATPASTNVQIIAGTTGTSPLRLTTSGSALLTSPLSGTIETDGTSLYWTSGAGTRAPLASTNIFTSTVAGLTPASGGGTTTFLRADGTFAAPPGGSSSFSVVTKAATYTEATTTGEIIILADLPAGFTITLPTAVANAAKFTIKKMQSAGSIVVNTTSSQTIDGGLNAILTTQYSAITMVSNNSNWMLI